MTGDLGLHLVHHLSARVPNDNLQRAHDELDVFRDVPAITVWDGFETARPQVWSAEHGRLPTWREVRTR